MSLHEYNHKRNFSRTREPEGKSRGHGSGNLYLIQKHAASRLHYDFRLEMQNVLKSWAVPKGPSLDPGEKRLAVHVEDHPVPYGSFEGTIPKGEYGGGTVMIWDTGTWEPLGDPEKDYKKGKLKFRLQGEKLQGIWTLAQMGGRAGEDGKNWLLIKHRDDNAIPEDKFNILEASPLSAVSDRSLEEIAHDHDEAEAEAYREAPPDRKTRKLKQQVKGGSGLKKLTEASKLSSARKAPMPGTIKPQLATLVKKAPIGDDWIHEIKFDGYRTLAMKNKDDIRICTRNGKDWTGKFPALTRLLQQLPATQAIVDGEVVVLRRNGTTDFQALQNAIKDQKAEQLVYYVFDLPYCNGYDLSKTPLLERKSLLKSLLDELGESDVIRFSDHILSSGKDVYDQSCRLALEGIISKKADSGYVQKRSRSWLKVKCINRQEFVVGGFTKPSGSRSGFGALLLGYYDKNQLIYAGRVGTGFSQASLASLEKQLRKLERKTSPYQRAIPGKTADIHWVKPQLVVEVEFTEWTQEGHLRHPSFKGLREDKAARDIGRESPKTEGNIAEDSTESRPAAPARGKRKSSAVSVAGVRLSNPDKILFPEQGVTKLALAEFYEEIADYVLPYIIHRPLTLVRCPQGRQKKCFYQKHINNPLPEHIRAMDIQEKTKTEKYIVIDDLPGLITLVQMGVLEFHPWGSHEKNIEKPDSLTFDLDPDEGLGWKDVIDAAALLRQRLLDLDLEPFLKTSGGKGLHLVVPIQRRTPWDDAKAFTKAVAQDLVSLQPDRFIANMSKAKRKGKIFIDYLRNGRGATSVAAYSSRARSGAPVSTPVFWDELNKDLKPDSFTVGNLRKRLSNLKEDPWRDFSRSRQSITQKMKTELGMKT